MCSFSSRANLGPVLGRRLIGGVAVPGEHEVGRVHRSVLGTEERVVQIGAVSRAPQVRRQTSHAVADKTELVRRDPVIGGARHADGKRMAQEAAADERRATALHPENENRPFERNAINGGEPSPRRQAPTVSALPARGLHRDGSQAGRMPLLVRREEVREPARSKRHALILPGALASLREPGKL
jgi:hypothetical protein